MQCMYQNALHKSMNIYYNLPFMLSAKQNEINFQARETAQKLYNAMVWDSY